jgi:transcriptional regulator with XRE-family HTH domain
MSQEEMATILDMSRLTYASIESGKRDLKTKELDTIARIFETTREQLIQAPVSKIQFDKTHPQYKMIQTILYILAKTAGKPNIGKTALNKLLYFADYNHYEKYRTSITRDEYIKMPRGPVPKSIDSIAALMEQSGLISIVTSEFHQHQQIRYIPNTISDVQCFVGTEVAELDYVIEQYGDKNAKRLTDFSHEDTPRKATKNIGEVIEYDLVHYRSPLYSVTEFADEDD